MYTLFFEEMLFPKLLIFLAGKEYVQLGSRSMTTTIAWSNNCTHVPKLLAVPCIHPTKERDMDIQYQALRRLPAIGSKKVAGNMMELSRSPPRTVGSFSTSSTGQLGSKTRELRRSQIVEDSRCCPSGLRTFKERRTLMNGRRRWTGTVELPLCSLLA